MGDGENEGQREEARREEGRQEGRQEEGREHNQNDRAEWRAAAQATCASSPPALSLSTPPLPPPLLDLLRADAGDELSLFI